MSMSSNGSYPLKQTLWFSDNHAFSAQALSRFGYSGSDFGRTAATYTLGSRIPAFLSAMPLRYAAANTPSPRPSLSKRANIPSLLVSGCGEVFDDSVIP